MAYFQLNARTIVAFIVIVTSVILGFFLPWEIGGESWGYWLFANELANGNGFIVSGRSPLYTVYLLPFNLFTYPLSVDLEYMVTTVGFSFAFYIFLKNYLSPPHALLFCIIWIPFFHQNEPHVQLFSLAFVCIAFMIRLVEGTVNERQLSLSYGFLLLAVLFRSNFAVFLLLVLFLDFFTNFDKSAKFNSLVKTVKPLFSKFSLAVVIILMLTTIFKSEHRWNNAWLSSVEWFPKSSESLSTTSIIGHYNWRYIIKEHGSFEGQDIYFTHKKAFDDSVSITEMIRSNPKLFIDILATHVKGYIAMTAFSLPNIVPSNQIGRKVVRILLFLALLYGAFRASSDNLTRIFIAGCVLSSLVAALSFPKMRYMIPFIPVIALSAWWYGNFTKTIFLKYAKYRSMLLLSKFIIPIVLIVFSWYPINSWLKIELLKSNTVNSLSNTRQSVSMSAAYPDIIKYSNDCKGIMSGEHKYFSAYVVKNKSIKIYDIWEIPPFGEYNDSSYKGLDVNRIDCLFISYKLESNIGMGTNMQLRFVNYIHPYEQHMIENGAQSYEIPSYGRVVKF